ncbi:MAG: hypothetical protein AAFQ83_17110 [Bacteroidota bacterium]
MSTTSLSPESQTQIRKYRLRLFGMMAISSGIDALMFIGDVVTLVGTFGLSFLLDEIIEYFLSSLIAKNKMRLKRRYRIVGLLPVPGLTSLTIQALFELRKTYKDPEEILAKLKEGEVVEENRA